MTVAATTGLDRRGKTITTFVVFDAAAELGRMREGELLELVTDDFEPFRYDIAAWCDAAGHRLVSSESTPDGLRFLIEKAPVDHRPGDRVGAGQRARFVRAGRS